MTVYFQIGIRVIFVCYKKPLMTVSRQYCSGKFPKVTRFCLSLSRTIILKKNVKKPRQMKELKHFVETCCCWLDIGLEIWLQGYSDRETSLAITR